MNFVTIHTIQLYFLTLVFRITFQATIDNFVTTFQADIFRKWAYSGITDLDSLKLNDESAERGVANDGYLTRRAIERMIYKALSGQSVNVLILGGSTTIGADLGPNNLQLTYHYAVADWWNKTIGLLTGSYMHRKIIAVGGVGTTYFGHCWEEYVNKTDPFDIVTWEFAINDPDSLNYDKAVERFTRNILSMTSKPGLSFINFLRRGSFPRGNTQKCNSDLNKAAVVNSIASHYSSTSISWERAICKYRTSYPSKLVASDVFIGHHPNILGHAHAAYMLIKYLGKVIQDLSAKENDKKQLFGSNGQVYNIYYKRNEFLPNPMFMSAEEINKISVCWTGIKPDSRTIVPHSIFDLTVLQNRRFSTLRKSNWETGGEERYDVTGGYVSVRPNNIIKFRFTVQESSGSQQSVLYVSIRNKYFGGKVSFLLDDINTKKKYIDTSVKKKSGNRVSELMTVSHGTHVLTIQTITGGCHLCAIIIH